MVGEVEAMGFIRIGYLRLLFGVDRLQSCRLG